MEDDPRMRSSPDIIPPVTSALKNMTNTNTQENRQGERRGRRSVVLSDNSTSTQYTDCDHVRTKHQTAVLRDNPHKEHSTNASSSPEKRTNFQAIKQSLRVQNSSATITRQAIQGHEQDFIQICTTLEARAQPTLERENIRHSLDSPQYSAWKQVVKTHVQRLRVACNRRPRARSPSDRTAGSTVMACPQGLRTVSSCAAMRAS